MKAAKWRDLSDDELAQKAHELSEEIFNLRFQLSMGVAKNPSRIGQARRDLARAYTIRRERGGAPLALTAPAPAAPATESAPPAPKRGKQRTTTGRTKAAKAPKSKTAKTTTKKKTAKG
jgi:large subunit ribosomal protein L29